jgi:hypothetical protein
MHEARAERRRRAKTLDISRAALPTTLEVERATIQRGSARRVEVAGAARDVTHDSALLSVLLLISFSLQS